jgi:hypothetical protein
MKQLLLALAIPLFAAQNDWDALLRISPTQETMVQTIDGKRHTGAFASYTDDAVIIQTRKGQLSFEKPRVQLVTARLKPRSHSARKGAVIGGGICLALAIRGGKEVAAAAPTFAGLGALIGLNQNTMTIIYRKK